MVRYIKKRVSSPVSFCIKEDQLYVFLEDILLTVIRKIEYVGLNTQVLLVISVFFDVVLFDDNDFDVAVAAVVTVVLNFDCVDFIAPAAGIDLAAANASFGDFTPAVAEILLLFMMHI